MATKPVLNYNAGLIGLLDHLDRWVSYYETARKNAEAEAALAQGIRETSTHDPVVSLLAYSAEDRFRSAAASYEFIAGSIFDFTGGIRGQLKQERRSPAPAKARQRMVQVLLLLHGEVVVFMREETQALRAALTETEAHAEHASIMDGLNTLIRRSACQRKVAYQNASENLMGVIRQFAATFNLVEVDVS